MLQAPKLTTRQYVIMLEVQHSLYCYIAISDGEEMRTVAVKLNVIRNPPLVGTEEVISHGGTSTRPRSLNEAQRGPSSKMELQ